MDKYRIVSITKKDGKDRTDGRYPLCIGHICKRPEPVKENPMYVEYISNPDGSDYLNRYLRTSTVTDFYEQDNVFQVETKNSIYRFEKC